MKQSKFFKFFKMKNLKKIFKNFKIFSVVFYGVLPFLKKHNHLSILKLCTMYPELSHKLLIHATYKVKFVAFYDLVCPKDKRNFLSKSVMTKE